MISVVEVIRKTAVGLELGWKPEPGVNVINYKLYCSTVPTAASMSLLRDNINPAVKRADTPGLGKVYLPISQTEIQTVLGSSVLLSETTIYLLLTYVDVSGESLLSASTIVEVPPTGIILEYLRDDPTINRSPFVFSHDRQRWVKTAGSSSGALITSSSIFNTSNEITEYTYDSSGSVATAKSYLPDATTAGCPAKLITYTYGDPSWPTKPTKVVITDSTI